MIPEGMWAAHHVPEISYDVIEFCPVDPYKLMSAVEVLLMATA